MARKALSASGILVSLASGLALVLFTFNPSGHSYYHWVLLAWISLVALGLVLGVGLSWSLVRGRITGQVDVDRVDR